jgi:hypothetical protein
MSGLMGLLRDEDFKIQNQVLYDKMVELCNKKSVHYIQNPNTNQNIAFEFDKIKMEQYFRYYYPKLIEDKKYYVISMRSWGMGDKTLLYVDETGENFYIQSSIKN